MMKVMMIVMMKVMMKVEYISVIVGLVSRTPGHVKLDWLPPSKVDRVNENDKDNESDSKDNDDKNNNKSECNRDDEDENNDSLQFSPYVFEIICSAWLSLPSASISLLLELNNLFPIAVASL